MDRTLIVVKPDAVQRQLVGQILGRFERKGLKLVALKMLAFSRRQAEQMYQAHKDEEFYEPLVEFLTSGPVVAAVLEGRNAVPVVRNLLGDTFCGEAQPGTIRGDLGVSLRANLVHASDSDESYRREVSGLFQPDELMDYRLDVRKWLYYGPDAPSE